MTIGASLFCIAVGAILHWAVTASVSGVDLQTVGTILIIVGVIGLLITLFIYIRDRDTAGPAPPL
jgi:uncharacterized membrane protein YvlD (DUF360 family)